MTTSRYFTLPELKTLRNAVSAEREMARNAATHAPDHVIYRSATSEVTRLTRLMAKLKAPCMF